MQRIDPSSPLHDTKYSTPVGHELKRSKGYNDVQEALIRADPAVKDIIESMDKEEASEEIATILFREPPPRGNSPNTD